jgi:tRNA1(Val) A37 N6-methylase TrmN6
MQTFNTIHAILGRLARLRPLSEEEIFYDLGSGSGKVLFAASLCHSFRKCVGIEYLESLYSISVELRDQIRGQAETIEDEVNSILSQGYTLPNIEIYNADFEHVPPPPRSSTGATAPSSSSAAPATRATS